MARRFEGVPLAYDLVIELGPGALVGAAVESLDDDGEASSGRIIAVAGPAGGVSGSGVLLLLAYDQPSETDMGLYYEQVTIIEGCPAPPMWLSVPGVPLGSAFAAQLTANFLQMMRRRAQVSWAHGSTFNTFNPPSALLTPAHFDPLAAAEF